MSQVGEKLRRGDVNDWWHWCPGCQMAHRLPSGWTFNNDFEKPTFVPSFRHGWGRDEGKVCHYNLVDGVLQFCTDSTHAMAGQNVPLPDLPLDFVL